MNSPSVTASGATDRPWYLQAFRKWYSWAGLALTLTGAYLACDGQLRFTGTSQLQAAPWEPAPASQISWKATTTSQPTVDPEFTRSTPARGSAQVKEILGQYLDGPEVVRTAHNEAPEEGPKIVPPPVPADTKEQPTVVAPTLIGQAKDPAEPVIIEPKSIKDAAILLKETPRLPTELPDSRRDVKAPAALPLDPALVQKSETIPVKPTPIDADPKGKTAEGVQTLQEELAKEAESLNADQRLLYSAAQNAAAAKNYPLMIERFEALFRMRPDLIHIRNEYGGLLITAGEYARAIEQYMKLVDRLPRVLQYRARLGDIYIINKQFKRAIEQFTELMKLAPQEAEYAVRLARAYVYDNDYTRALQIFDSYLAQIRPDEARAPAALGALLLDLDMPVEAMPYLLNKRKQLERDAKRNLPRENQLLEILANMVRGYARLGERQQAMEVLAELPTIATDQIATRETLGNQLLGIDEFELAAQAYNQILQLDATNGAAIIGMARVYLELAQPALARQILDNYRPAPKHMRDYLSVYSVYHQRVGEYIEARQIYTDMLRRDESDHETRLALGQIHNFYRDEWERAKAEFAKIPPMSHVGREARRNFATALMLQRKFGEAIEVIRMLVQEDPTDAPSIALAVHIYAKAKKFEPGIALARGYLATSPRPERHANAVRLALGNLLVDANRNMDAVREFEMLLSRPSGRTVEAYYGLARAHDKLGNAERARQYIACTAALPGGEFRNKLRLAELYADDYEDNSAIALCLALLQSDGTHLPAMIRLGDSQQRVSRFSGQPADVFTTAQRMLALSPSNVRGHLMMARSFAVAQNFRKAAGQYDQLIRLDPQQYTPRIERARVLYSDKQYSAARSQYEEILSHTPDEVIVVAMSEAIGRNPKVRTVLEPYAAAGVGGEALRKEIARLSISVPDMELRIALHRLVCDYDARAARNNAVKLEMDAFEWKDFRAFRAIAALQASIAFEPTNSHSMFSLGQQYAVRNWTSQALEAYGNVLSVDPTHRDAIVAAERANAEMGPKLDASYSFFRQRGRQGLASIDRERYQAAGRIPLGDEDEYLALGYARAANRPTDGDPLNLGNIPFFRVQKRFWGDQILAYGQMNVEEWRYGFDTHPTFDVGATYYWCDWISWRVGGYLENVAENGESMRQNIHRGGVYIGADFRPTRQWGLGGQWRFGHYSDNNDMNEMYLYNDLALTLPPKMLKIAQRLYFWGYREGTIFPTDPPQDNNLFGATHPYFSPNGYAQIEMRVEWWHWLSRDYFAHSNQCWYSLQYGIMTDNTLTTFHNLKGTLNYDVCTWLTIGGEASCQLSSVYNMYSAMGFLQVRFK
jgi:tetratricopeptide (TPR) repeat protein